MKLSDVRDFILRRYLQVTFGGAPETAAAVEGATFDEYVALRRILFPGATPQNAAQAAPTMELREAGAAKEAARAPTKPPLRRFVEVKGRQRVDLRKHAIPEDVQILSLKGIKALGGWSGLDRFSFLEDLNVVACDSSGDAGASGPATELRHLQLHSCGDVCTKMMLAAVHAAEIVIDAAVFDARLLEAQTRLAALHLSVGRLQNVGALGGLPATRIGVGWIEPDARMKEMLHEVSGRVSDLRLRGTRPFGPELLPTLPSLEHLSVPGYAEYRDVWIEWSMGHRNVATAFTSVLPRPNGLSLQEVYRGIDILRITKGKTRAFELSGDFAAELRRAKRFVGSNGDLEDDMASEAKRAKKRIQWSSEADTFVAHAADLPTARWLVEQLVERGLRNKAS